MWLALDTSTQEVSVALGRPGELLAEEAVGGSRQHARALVPMIERALSRAGVDLTALSGVLVTDGPGSFTGLRIGASVAKALAHTLKIELWHTPSLLAQAAGCIPECSGRVLAVSDALRGDVYAAVYRFPHGRIEVDVHPSVFKPAELVAEVPAPKVIAGTLAPHLLEPFDVWQERGSVLFVESSPNAAVLLELLGHAGGLSRVPSDRVGVWEPNYGRPAEAQAKWEQAHGAPLDLSDRPS